MRSLLSNGLRAIRLLLLLVGAHTCLGQEADNRYFIVGEASTHSSQDSFVIPIKDLEDIEHARLLYRTRNAGDPDWALTVERPVVFAAIVPWSTAYSRNYLQAGSAQWSWSVSEVIDFTDGSRAVYDGKASFVEEDVSHWIANTDGYIGFLHYTVIGELPLGINAFYQDHWKLSEWFGTYNDEHWPWVHSAGMGWLYVESLDPAHIWIWIPFLGWCWTSEATYPWLFRLEDNTWLYYFHEDPGLYVSPPETLWFYNATTASYEWHERGAQEPIK